jgi:hypothetical protein
MFEIPGEVHHTALWVLVHTEGEYSGLANHIKEGFVMFVNVKKLAMMASVLNGHTWHFK